VLISDEADPAREMKEVALDASALTVVLKHAYLRCILVKSANSRIIIFFVQLASNKIKAEIMCRNRA